MALAVLVGTCGFSYADWTGVFYPIGIDRAAMLSYYARHFPAVELDYTYYAMPAARTLAAMAARTPAEFLFCVKAYRDMTHRGDLPAGELARLGDQFRKALDPLTSRGRLGCVLVQYPWSFKPSGRSLEAILEIESALADLPVVVEFRNVEWIKKETFLFLHEQGLGFCAVDEPRLPGLLPPLALATSEIGYLRFHGRNAAKWWNHAESAERYSYDYSDEELAEWVPKILELGGKTKRTFVMLNNHHMGFAVRNALRLQSMLAGLE